MLTYGLECWVLIEQKRLTMETIDAHIWYYWMVIFGGQDTSMFKERCYKVHQSSSSMGQGETNDWGENSTASSIKGAMSQNTLYPQFQVLGWLIQQDIKVKWNHRQEKKLTGPAVYSRTSQGKKIFNQKQIQPDNIDKPGSLLNKNRKRTTVGG